MDRLKSAVDKILARLPNARGRGEEATKQSLVLPLLDALGYDIGNPAEVCPEYEADFAIKKYGQKEKVDLALFLQDVPRIYVEVKSVDDPLDGHEGQLSRYCNATPTPSKSVYSPETVLQTRPRPRHFHHPPGLGPRTASTPKAPPLPAALRTPASCPNGHMVCVSRPRKGAGTQRPPQRPTPPEPIRESARERNDTARIVDFLRDKLDLRDRDPSGHLVLAHFRNCGDSTLNQQPRLKLPGSRARTLVSTSRWGACDCLEFMLSGHRVTSFSPDAPRCRATLSVDIE